MHEVEDVHRLLRSLRGVWDEEAVDELDHAPQAAARARDDGADDELILAAALHDLAHSPLIGGPGTHRHDRVARDWLTPRFGERVGWLAGAHVAAKDPHAVGATVDDALTTAEHVVAQRDTR